MGVHTSDAGKRARSTSKRGGASSLFSSSSCRSLSPLSSFVATAPPSRAIAIGAIGVAAACTATVAAMMKEVARP